MMDKDEYVADILKGGDRVSRIIRAATAPTLSFVADGFGESLIEVMSGGMGGVAVARIPENCSVLVHSEVGDPGLDDPRAHAESLIHRLAAQARTLGAVPVAFDDVADVSRLEEGLARAIGEGLFAGAKQHNVANLNGESAGLGARVTGQLNIMGTMISIRPKADGEPQGVPFAYASFDPKGMRVWMNSDGGGTVFEFYERASELAGATGMLSGEFLKRLTPYGIESVWGLGAVDTAAMLADDTVRQGARIKAISAVAETRGTVPLTALRQAAASIGKAHGIEYAFNAHDASSRWRGWQEDAPAYNISGSSVSVIDEYRLRNPPRPNEGNVLLAVQSAPTNRRSNGISDLRRAAVALYGEEWHRRPEGRTLLEYLLRPSTVFYTAFHELLDARAADAVFHMSGGAMEGKLAAPLAKEGLYVAVTGLFEPDPTHVMLANAIKTTEENARRKWPYGNEAYAATDDPEMATEIFACHGLIARRVGIIEKARGGKTGVEIMDRHDEEGRPIYFRGLEKAT